MGQLCDINMIRLWMNPLRTTLKTNKQNCVFIWNISFVHLPFTVSDWTFFSLKRGTECHERESAVKQTGSSPCVTCMRTDRYWHGRQRIDCKPNDLLTAAFSLVLLDLPQLSFSSLHVKQLANSVIRSHWSWCRYQNHSLHISIYVLIVTKISKAQFCFVFLTSYLYLMPAATFQHTATLYNVYSLCTAFCLFVALIIKKAGNSKHGHCRGKIRSVTLVLYLLR